MSIVEELCDGEDMNNIDAVAFFKEIESSDEFHYESAKLEFALKLKRAMERENLKNAQLVERLGVSRSTVSKLLRGDANVTIETMVKGCRALGGRLFIKIACESYSARRGKK